MVAIIIFHTLFFSFYTRLKWLTHHHITILGYSEFDYVLIFTTMLYIFMISC